MPVAYLLLLFLFGANANAVSVPLSPEEQAFLKQHPTIVLGSDPAWAPYVIKNNNGDISGFDADILNLVNQYTGANFVLRTGTWNDIVNKAETREIDGLSTSVAHPERKTAFNFSDIYVSESKSLLVSTTNPKNILSHNDLAGKIVSYQKGNLFDKKLLAQYSGVKAIALNSLDEILEQLITGKTDATVGSQILLYYGSQKGLHYLNVVDIFDQPRVDVVFSIRNDWPLALSILNKGLSAISSKQKNELKSKWFFSSIPNKQPTQIKLTDAEKNYLNQTQNIRMCIDPDWMPFEKNDNGKHIGMTADYFELLQEKLNSKISMVPSNTWLESLELGKKRECDIFSLVMSTPEREKYLDFTDAYLSIPLVIATSIETPFINDITSVNDKKIGIVKGYAYGELLRTRYPQMQLLDVKNLSDGLDKVKDRELFGFIGTLATVGYTIQKDYIGRLKIAGKFDESWELGIGTRNDVPILHSIFNKAVNSISYEKHQQILNKWVSVNYEKGFDYSLLWQMLASIAIVILFIGYRHYLLLKHNEKLKILSSTDALTGLANRSRIDELLEKYQYKNERYGETFSIILLDIDNFKTINDEHGHSMGDTILKAIAKILQHNVRLSDTVGRWGGEEFLIICPQTDLNSAYLVAEKLRVKVQQHPFPHIRSLTISLGVTSYTPGYNLDNLFKQADDLLYQAKNKGKNCTMAEFERID